MFEDVDLLVVERPSPLGGPAEDGPASGPAVREVDWAAQKRLRAAQLAPERRDLLLGELVERKPLGLRFGRDEHAVLVTVHDRPGEDVERTAGSHEAPRPASAPEAGAGPPAHVGEALKRFTIDLSRRAREGDIDPIFGRDQEIRQVLDILGRRRKNNAILVGEAGVGKTAVVEGLALRIVEGDVPESLTGVEVRTLNLGALQAGAGVKGEFENRLKDVLRGIREAPKPTLLFIDEAHTLIGAGGQAGTGDAANLLKPALARGELRTIAATTWSEYKRHIEKDPALERRFQLVKVEEPSRSAATPSPRSRASSSTGSDSSSPRSTVSAST